MFLVFRVKLKALFAILDVIVGKIPHQAPLEWRQLRKTGSAVIIDDLLDIGTGIAGLDFKIGSVFDGQFPVEAGKFQLGVVTQKGISPPFLGVFKAFQNKALPGKTFEDLEGFHGI
jgi:hypothetical protein